VRSHAKAPTAGSSRRPVERFGHISSGALVLLFACAALALCAAPASAASPLTFAKFGSGADQVSAPYSVAVDRSSGDVYVAERGNFRISKFDAAGEFLMAWGLGVADGSTYALQTCGPQASPPTTRCFAGLDQFDNPIAAALSPESLAVDQSTGDVYASNPLFSRVEKFSSDGEFLLMLGREVNTTPGTPHPDLCTAADVGAGDTCGRGTSGSEPGQFGSPRALAVDSVGNLWVADTERLQQFNADGTFAGQIALPGGGQTLALAVNLSDDFYVRSREFPGIRKLEAGTGALLETLDAGGDPRTVTVGASDDLYVGDATSPYRFLVFDPAGEQVAQFGAGQVIGRPEGNGIAVNEAVDSLYTASHENEALGVDQLFSLPQPGPLVQDERAEDVLPTTATLAATLNPEGHETTYRFEYGLDSSYGSSTPTQTLPSTGFEEEDVGAALDHLIPDTTYHFRLLATNHCNSAEPAEECTVAGEDATFTTPTGVKVDDQWATEVAASSASLHAELDPQGVAATWWLEYGTDEGYGQSTPEMSLGSGFGDVTVGAAIDHLLPGRTYHYRFAARDERDGVVYLSHGADRTFVTQLSGLGFTLADNRAWEMVSPPNKHGGQVVIGRDSLAYLNQAAADGSGIAYTTQGSIEAEPQGNRALEDSTVLAARGAQGWSSQDLTPPHTELTGFQEGGEYKLFTPNLGRGLLEARDATPLSPASSERTPYLRESTDPPIYTPLVTSKEGFANVPPGTEFDPDPSATGSSENPVALRAANSTLSHVAIQSVVPLTPGASANALYEWSGGQLKPVSILPAGEGGGFAGEVRIGSEIGSTRHAISADGSRVFWSVGQFYTGVNLTALYMRDTTAGETARLDVAQPGAVGTGLNRPVFQGASADGSVAYFTDTQQLTEDASGEGRDLYRCVLSPPGTPPGCDSLTDLSAPLAGSDENADVTGTVSGFGEDGDSVYFVARGVLDTAPNQDGDAASASQPNLYHWAKGEGVRFVATLSQEDSPAWGVPILHPSEEGQAALLNAATSPSGRYLVFMSKRSLTGYDNRDATSGEPVEEVYRYDSLEGRLECVSCNPSAGRPAGRELSGFAPGVDLHNLWGGLRLAATLPEPSENRFAGRYVFYRPRSVLDNGRVFFNAADSLVASDSNGQWDVYQYESTGVGDCSAASGGAGISRTAGGCVSLLSSGTSEEETSFLDASASGDDVFFMTRAKLSVTDEDTAYDVYDARVDGVPATLLASAECLGEACQPAAVAPNDPTPSSASFKGQGNLKQAGARKRCAKGKRQVSRKGKARCVARKHHSEHRAAKERRAGR
jgi:DNA-binding beta-propeller fold protein YncE